MSNHQYRDKYPRTLQEAFGPYAEMKIERRTRIARIMPWLYTLLCVVFICTISWAVQ